MRRRIQAEAGIQAYDIYGLSEIVGPGVAIDVPARMACTFSRTTSTPRSWIRKAGEPLPDGAEGELVLTTLSKQAMPMIRYRTRDITRLIASPCLARRTLRRMERISRRSDDMFIIRG